MSASILVVDDDRFLQERLVKLLQAEGYEADGVGSGEEALVRLQAQRPDLVVLDLGLPGMDGLTTCRRIRKQWRMPVLMLTARNDAADKALGLETGADDYLAKPFEPIEFIARVRAQLRRFHEYRDEPEVAAPAVFALGEMRIDYDKREVSVSGRTLELTTREYEVLAYLSRNRDRAVSREQLFERVWGFEMYFTTNTLDVHMYRIRKKLEANPDQPRYLHTMRGYGYKLALNP